MTFTYTFADAEGISLKREDDQGNIAWVPTDPANRDYAEFLRSGAKAAPYVAPPELKPLTAEEKLANAGLTVDELKQLLA